MTRSLIFICLLNFSLSFGQKITKNVFELDSINHIKYVNRFIDNLNLNSKHDMIILYDFNFVSNDTYVYWKVDNVTKATLISNQKPNGKIKRTNLELSDYNKTKLNYLLGDINFKTNKLYNLRKCYNEIYHKYLLKLNLHNKEIFIESTCFPKARENEVYGFILQLIDEFDK